MRPEYPDEKPKEDAADLTAGKATLPRRDFLALAGLTMAGTTAGAPVMAGPFAPDDFHGTAPPDKRLRKEWVESLTARGSKTVYRGAELEKIGMPIGGIGAGQVYLGGDGRLWHWDIFNIPHGTGDANYAHPPAATSPIDQGFTLSISSGDDPTVTRELSSAGFHNIRFSGQYPIGTVEYEDADCPITATLEAFSPFIPLNADDSSLPATIMQFTLRNRGPKPVTAAVTGRLENAICLTNRGADGTRTNRFVYAPEAAYMNATVEKSTSPAPEPRADRLIENWQKATYEGWTVEGSAFGTGPIRRADIPNYQGDVGGPDERVVNSHATAPGGDVGGKDGKTGKLTSRLFIIDRSFLQFWIGGGNHEGKTCLNLLVDGKVIRSQTGKNDNRMSLATLYVRDLQGKTATIEIVDAESGGWGNIGVGRITLTDRSDQTGRLEDLPDYGTMTLAVAGSSKLPDSDLNNIQQPTAPLSDRLVGTLRRSVNLVPNSSATITFVIAWHFPNLEIGGLSKVGRWYPTRFSTSETVVQYVVKNLARLTSQTRLWRDTWYDSTLPHWFLDRTLLNVSTLGTSACYRFANGRFYAWEGVGCCAGTCTHVWHYAHAVARLFPELERDTRERVDLGVAFHADTGVMGFRAEFDPSLAVDGQAGTLLRMYREHQMSPDSSFLKRNWAKIKKAFDPLLALDADGDGVLEGPQMNTLDQAWFGKVAWLSSLYLAALRAGGAMAREMGDAPFAKRCSEIVDHGAKSIDSLLFNGEYYQQIRDETRARTVGSYDGCEIDQVFGDSWVRQVGLPPILPREHIKSALRSLWKYNFLPDVGPFRAAHKAGRVYAMAGEAGLIMCSWPKGESARVAEGFDFYFNECMTGFEYQVAGHMLWEGMVTEGLAITRAIHDRYHASRRNPWNEVECGDHYSRAMASYGVYMAACGMEVHSPKGHLGFAPRIGAANFKAAFTTADGWGVFAQSVKAGKRQATITVAYGIVRLKTISLGTVPGLSASTRYQVRHNGALVPASAVHGASGDTIVIALDLVIAATGKVEIRQL